MAWPGEGVRSSRFTRAVLERVSPWSAPDVWLGTLLDFAKRQPEPPVLFYGQDGDLLAVSRFRERLGESFRFVVPSATLVEDLLDKARFQALSELHSLPVPPSRPLSSTQQDAERGLRFPVIVKPLTHEPQEVWEPIAGGGKAVRVDTAEELRALATRLAGLNIDAVAQELIPGAETRIESYHVYVDEHGEIVAEFTGVKIRTAPSEFGYSTAVQITDSPRVTELGRDLVRRLDLRGVAKLDFKRGPDDRLYLLEINPRFNLWHHPGAKAGVNLPAIVYGDLAGLPRRHVPRARAGVRWCYHWHDARAAGAHGISFFRWLPWAVRCEAKSSIAWDDPLPIVSEVVSRLRRRLRRSSGQADAARA